MTNNDRASLPHMQLAWEHHSEMRSCRVDALQVQIQSAVWTLIVAGCVGRCGQLEPVLVFAWVTREHSEHSSNTLRSEHCLLKMHPKKVVRKKCVRKNLSEKNVSEFFFRSRRITLKSTYLQYLQIIRGIIISALHKTTKKYLKQNKQQFQVLWGQPEIRYTYMYIYNIR